MSILIKKGESANNGAVTNPDSMKKVYIRQLDHTLISGWLYTEKNVFSISMMLPPSTGCSLMIQPTPRFYDFQKNAWLGFSLLKTHFYDRLALLNLTTSRSSVLLAKCKV